jgi:AraC-like DNA-binding protein
LDETRTLMVKQTGSRSTSLEPLDFQRPEAGPVWQPEAHGRCPVEISGRPGWQSNGGVQRGHPARTLPFTLEAAIPPVEGRAVRLHIVGIFAIWASKKEEAAGTLGATVQLLAGEEVAYRHDLLNGRHYVEATDLTPLSSPLGDGSSLHTLGTCEHAGRQLRVDLLTIDLPEGVRGDRIRFKDLGSPASFIVLDVFLEYEEAEGCPFKARSGGVSLGELASIVRVGDRVKLLKAIAQLERSLTLTEDLDEARGQALTFIAVITAGTLELGASRDMHRVQLEAARAFDRLHTQAEVAEEAKRIVERIAAPILEPASGPSSHLIDKALSYIDRNFAKDLTDASVADQLGLSTSHFRYLFKQATGQPFHKYLVALRLERARAMLLDRQMPVSEVATAVGFTGLSHFSRAFAQRFSVSPTNLRKSA